MSSVPCGLYPLFSCLLLAPLSSPSWRLTRPFFLPPCPCASQRAVFRKASCTLSVDLPSRVSGSPTMTLWTTFWTRTWCVSSVFFYSKHLSSKAASFRRWPRQSLLLLCRVHVAVHVHHLLSFVRGCAERARDPHFFLGSFSSGASPARTAPKLLKAASLPQYSSTGRDRCRARV